MTIVSYAKKTVIDHRPRWNPSARYPALTTRRHMRTNEKRSFVHVAQLLNHTVSNVVAVTGHIGYSKSQTFLLATDSSDDAKVLVVCADSVDLIQVNPIPDSDWADT